MQVRLQTRGILVLFVALATGCGLSTDEEDLFIGTYDASMHTVTGPE